MKKRIITHATIYTESATIKNGYIKIKNGKIEEINSMENLSISEGYEKIAIPSSYKVIPGRIDLHIHGAGGADTMDATNEALSTIANALPKEGTTSFLATTITQSKEAIERALQNVASYKKSPQTEGEAEIVGIHLEGPFLNYKKAGAQPFQYMLHPSIDIFNLWQNLADGLIKVVTVAPEMPGGYEFIRHLHQNGVIASIGHSDATNDEMIQAIEAGAKQVTHLFNGMRGLHHRDPGTAGAALLHESLKVELIADGIHVHPQMIHLAYQLKKKEGIILITDSMRAKCLKNGTYDLGGQQVTVKDDMAILENGTLAGSVLRMNDAVKNMMKYTNCSLEESIRMSSVNPAKQIGIYDRKGSITVGKDADIVILNDENDVHMTICQGSIAFQKEDT
ncbi:N-acetylglucosamine-6-phosphate deacetylase [Bacillus sp. FJAT-47783]|uniref:N-acetylglucosamine-6-phosphate deacetylase n=1 Tax=Bacillus sp. FJAT-47783 TaxID=2922712 RepID=UPI001FAD3886|nr:N-acetylglucosamine-6-phosphate deacetylase [Bacillus sp. FJAT-47783]